MICLYCMVFLITILSIPCSTNEIESTTQSLVEQVLAEVENIKKMQTELEKEENQLKLDREQLEKDKQTGNSIHPQDVIELNIGGEIIATTRQTLTNIPKSILSLLFNGRWEHKLPIDEVDKIRLDFHPNLFRHLLHQLQTFDSNKSVQFHLPSQPSLVESFKKMLKKLGFDQLLSLEKKNINIFNVGGKMITNRRTILTSVSNSTSDTIISPSTTINIIDEHDAFLDYDPKLFQYLIKQLRTESFPNISYLGLPSYDQRISFVKMLADLNIQKSSDPAIKINFDSKWMQNGITVAGGNNMGAGLNQFNRPRRIFFDDVDQSIYIVDGWNNRLVHWKSNATSGQIVEGGNQSKGLDNPSELIFNKKNNSFIISDNTNQRIVEWSRQNNSHRQVLFSNICSWGLAMDKDGSIYISSLFAHEVRRWKAGDTHGVVVAGGNGEGNHLNQLRSPHSIFVDEDYSLYISDHDNHRVMKWIIGAKEGLVVAGGHGYGNGLNQLNYPRGLFVDQFGRIYIADRGNNRVVRWNKGDTKGVVIIGGNGVGNQSNQFDYPVGLTFDRQGNLYVSDHMNHRIQKFTIESKP